MNGIPIRGTAKGSAGAAFTIAKRRGAKRLDFLLAYLTELYAFAPRYDIDADVLVAQADLETGAFTSDYYTRDGNVAGFGVPSKGPAQGLTYGAAEAAQAQVIHHCSYLGIAVSLADQRRDPRWQDVIRAGFFGTVTTTADYGNGRWAEDPDYARKLIERYTAYWGYPSQQETPPMSLERYTDIPGRPGYAFWLPSDIDVRTQVVSHPRVRSYTKFTGQHHDIVHDTGNDKTNAEGEFAWLKGGRQGGSAGGYNAITDSRRIILTGMFDEITWHGGTPTGNQTFGVEMAYGGGQNWDRVLEVNARLHAAICVAFGFDADDQLHLHQWIYGKYCSRQILNRKMWPQYVATVKRYMEEIKAAMRGEGEVIPDPATYAKPVPIPALVDALAAVANDTNPALTVAPRSVFDPQSNVRFYWVGDRVRAVRDTRRSQYASAGAQDVGGTITKDTEFDVNWLFLAGDGKEWYLTPYWTRVLAEDTERVSDSKVDTQEAA